jgi:serine/threonine protein kinase
MNRQTGEWFAVKMIQINKLKAHAHSHSHSTGSGGGGNGVGGNGGGGGNGGNGVGGNGGGGGGGNGGTGTAGTDDPKKNNAFAREISILETLRHPNICQLKEVFFDKANISAFCLFLSSSVPFLFLSFLFSNPSLVPIPLFKKTPR